MTATNGIGWEVQVYDEKTGWHRDGEPVRTKTDAERELEFKPLDGKYRRVYESLDFNPHKD